MSADIRLLRPDDAALLEDFLAAQWASSMLLRSNLRATPLGQDGVYAGTYAGAFVKDALRAVAAHETASKDVVLQGAPDAAAACAVLASRGRTVQGLLGPWACVMAAVAPLGLDYNARLCGVPEVLYTLNLAALNVPAPVQDGRWLWRRAQVYDLSLILPWRYAYCLETLGAKPGPALTETVRADMTRAVGEGRMFLLAADGAAVSMCGFSAELPDAVQVGKVWTPPDKRGRGYARGVVAATLQAARAEGVTRAALFTEEGNAPARKAYEALGFEAVGDYGMMMFA